MASPRFDAEEFCRRIMELSDADLIGMGRSVCSTASRWLDSVTRKNNKVNLRFAKESGTVGILENLLQEDVAIKTLRWSLDAPTMIASEGGFN
jgi:hypothetical protein